MRKTREPAEGIFLHTDNHPKLKKANDLIELARTLEHEVNAEQDRARKLLKAEYGFEVKSDIPAHDFWDKLPDTAEVIHITATLLNKDIFEAHMHYYGSVSMLPEETRSSVKYYRKHGLLFHTGGGWHLLNDEQPCSDEEWEMLKAGNIPEKFRR